MPGLSIADVGGGSLMATTGIMGALLARSRTGEGQFVDISMTDGVVSWLALHGADYLFGGVEPKGGERPFIGEAPCYNIYQCADGAYVALGAIEPHFWEHFCVLADIPPEAWAHFPSGEEANRCHALIAACMMKRTRDEWVALAAAADVPLSPVNTMEEAFRHPQIVHRRMIQYLDHPVEGRVPQLGFPIKLSGTPCTITRPPPRLGEHNQEMLAACGYDDEDVARLQKTGAI